MSRQKKDKFLLQKPTFPGGDKAMLLFIRDNLRYPEKARANKIEGTVRLRFSINYYGKVEQVHIVQGIGHGCDEEAARLVRMLEFETPRQHHYQQVLFHRTLNIHFKLAKETLKAPTPAPAQQASVVQYTLTPAASKQKEEEVKKPTGGVITYTINW
jgi:TonB family protein